MSDELFASVVTVGMLGALATWVPALGFLQGVIGRRRAQKIAVQQTKEKF